MDVKLVGFGYPLLDIIIDGSPELLNRYGLIPNGQVQASGDLIKIFNYVQMTYGDSIQYVPGGAAINAVKVAQWCIGKDDCTAVIGCLNDEDDFGQILQREMMRSRVKCYFQKERTASTGTCLVICTDQNRSLVTTAGAAKLFSTKYFEELEIQSVLNCAQHLYCTGFSLIDCSQGVDVLAHLATKNSGQIFAFNLAAVFISQQFSENIKRLLPFIDILFGNEMEADALISQCGYKINSMQEIALFLCNWETKKCNGHSRIVVITRGPSTSILAQEGKVFEFPVVDVTADQIIDTNGAGDAFVGGFLASLIKGESSSDAMKAGHTAAHVILKQRGCSLPNN
ncbi:unnamed protein product [Lymnaea stagnalis]|uniref:Adenosine kinase n=1 Tax=Lymnaea stagnalis TaxID=6523 RepID=A0AAV2IEF5_LYMST